MKKLQNIIDENIKYFWENDPLVMEKCENIIVFWDGFKTMNNNFNNWKLESTL